MIAKERPKHYQWKQTKRGNHILTYESSTLITCFPKNNELILNHQHTTQMKKRQQRIDLLIQEAIHNKIAKVLKDRTETQQTQPRTKTQIQQQAQYTNQTHNIQAHKQMHDDKTSISTTTNTTTSATTSTTTSKTTTTTTTTTKQQQQQQQQRTYT